MSDKYSHFEIRCGSSGRHSEIFMDGLRLKGVTKFQLQVDVDAVTKVIVEFIPAGVDVDVDARVEEIVQRIKGGADIKEGVICKGGVNDRPTTPRPEPPMGQGGDG